jgi:hypothetical protein
LIARGAVARLARLAAGASILTALLASGCATVTRTLPDGSTQRLRGEEIRTYAGEVFRRHNAASSTLLQALPVIEISDPAAADRLIEIEGHMNEACAPIDALAIAYRDGRDVDLGDKLAFSRALDDCEQASRRLEAALAALDAPDEP